MINFIKKLILKIVSKYNQFFFIGNSDTLPAPLDKNEELDLLIKAQKGDLKARNKLIEHNLRLVVFIAKKYETSLDNLEDIVSIGTIGLIKGINTYKVDKNIRLATYASRCISNEILMYLRKTGSRKAEISFDEPLNTDWDGNELLLSDVLASESDSVNYDIEYEDEKKLLLNVVSKLSERERLIINMRFGIDGQEEHTQKEVADKLGISQSYISRLEKRIISHIKKEMEKVS